MGDFGTNISTAHVVEIPSAVPGQPERPSAGAVTLRVRDHSNPSSEYENGVEVGTFGYWQLSWPGVDLIDISGDGGESWVGPLESGQAVESGAAAGSLAAAAAASAADAQLAAQQAQSSAQSGTGATWNVNIKDQPNTFPPSTHDHTVDEGNRDAPDFAKAFIKASTDKNAARAYIEAAPSSTKSFPGFGTTAGLAVEGNRLFKASELKFEPTTDNPATNVQDAITNAGRTGGSGGGSGTSAVVEVYWASGAYPTQAATPPAGIKRRAFFGPQQYVGPTWSGVLDTYEYTDALA